MITSDSPSSFAHYMPYITWKPKPHIQLKSDMSLMGLKILWWLPSSPRQVKVLKIAYEALPNPNFNFLKLTYSDPPLLPHSPNHGDLFTKPCMCSYFLASGLLLLLTILKSSMKFSCTGSLLTFKHLIQYYHLLKPSMTEYIYCI